MNSERQSPEFKVVKPKVATILLIFAGLYFGLISVCPMNFITDLSLIIVLPFLATSLPPWK